MTNLNWPVTEPGEIDTVVEERATVLACDVFKCVLPELMLFSTEVDTCRRTRFWSPAPGAGSTRCG